MMVIIIIYFENTRLRIEFKMLKKLYKNVIIALLRLFNYNKIKNENGNTHVVLNILDIILVSAYAFVSYWKLRDVSLLVLVVNFLTLMKLMLCNIKKSINVRDQYREKYLHDPGLSFKSAHDIKLIIELCTIAFSFIPFLIQGVALESHVIRSFAIVIISLGLADNILNIFIELFEADMEITKIN